MRSTAASSRGLPSPTRGRRLRIALVIIAGAVLAVVVLLTIETFLIDWGDW
jgi:hypothetical protein